MENAVGFIKDTQTVMVRVLDDILFHVTDGAQGQNPQNKQVSRTVALKLRFIQGPMQLNN